MSTRKKAKKDRNYLQLQPKKKLYQLAVVQAEADKELDHFYVHRERFVDRALDREDLASVFLGPKGMGKTAVLQMARIEKASESRRIIDISPDDLAFNALAQYRDKSTVLQDSQNYRFLFKALWDYVLLVEIFRREFSERRNLMKLFQDALPGHNWEKEAKKLVDLAYRQDERAGTFTARIIGLLDEVEMSGELGDGTKVSAKAKIKDQKPVSSIAILALINRVARDIPSKLNHEYWVLIDDLDIHWDNSEIQNNFLAALFESMRRLARNDSIKFVVSLRDNIFKQINLDEIDKYADLTVDVKWTKAIIKDLIEARLTYIFSIKQAEIWGAFFTQGTKALDYILERSTGRPRDVLRAVKYSIDAAIEAGDRDVNGKSVERGVLKYSEEAVLDWSSEHRHLYHGLQDIATWFRGQQAEFSIETIQELAFEVETKLASDAPDKPKCNWVLGFFDDPWALAKILLELNFLLVKDKRASSPRPYNPRTDRIAPNDIEWFAIQPRFRPALVNDKTVH